ncbi:CaiB/BaiF CoA transferase family protein [Sphingobium tyrosinilyticum]|uniref:CaiB/BaiF CoA transferase family protein n=1 Tax=Sphingobium tyrosinilyticum TaxID=2715436 RepID=A0ABV9F1J0_9SPHN
MLPLAGIKVLDLGSVLMAPYAAQWLADMGADVIKIEPPGGDTTRKIGPFEEQGMASLFLGVNRNKRSAVLDLKTEAGRSALIKLVETADVLLHNNRPRKMSALGLGPDVLLKVNPRLVYACMHGFGEAGPYGGRPAYDDIIQGLCGLADLTGQRTGVPAYLPICAADKTAGMVGAIAILSALVKREQVGQGAYVEIPMFEALVSYTAVEHLYGRHFEPAKGPAAYPRIMSDARRPYATRDGHICVMPYTDQHWRSLFLAVGRQDLADDTRFQGIAARTHNIDALYALLRDILQNRTTGEWMALLDAIEVPNAPVKSIEDLLEDPHLTAVGFFPTFAQANGKHVRMTGVPVLFDGERPPTRLPPALGADTRAVLSEVGLSSEEIGALD